MADLQQVFKDLIRLQIELWDAVDARLRHDCGLPLARYLPMQVIAQTASCRVYDIVRQLSITVGGASKAVDWIEAAGLCVRRPNPNDRRSSLLELTPAGETLLAQASVAVDDELKRRLGSTLSPGKLAQFHNTITTLRAAVADDIKPGLMDSLPATARTA
jgi:DNA-binding MarR family transcriptional regulator